MKKLGVRRKEGGRGISVLAPWKENESKGSTHALTEFRKKGGNSERRKIVQRKREGKGYLGGEEGLLGIPSPREEKEEGR